MSYPGTMANKLYQHLNGVNGMFIFTTKFSKRKAIVAVLILAAVLIAVILIAGAIGRSNASKTKEAASLSAVVKNNDQRVNYLNSLGWEVDKSPLEEQKVIIPREFSDVYKKYNDIQKSQGFDLQRYGGIEAQRYTYRVHNYPGASGNVVADLIVYRNEIIAGDVQSNAFDGFMVGLRYPRTLQPSPSTGPLTTASPNAPIPSPKPTAANPNAANPSAAASAKPNAANPGAANPSAKPNAAAPSATKTGALTSDASAIGQKTGT